MRISDWSSDVCSSDLKSPGNPVCEVDLEIDALLRTRLSALLPDAGWLSEETVDNEDRLAKDRVWVVDPIDGTRDYIRGREGWAVSIALVEHGQPVIGLRSEEHTSELQSLMRISYAVFCLKKKQPKNKTTS